MAFGWTNEPSYHEQKLANLFHTIDNALGALQTAYRNNNDLKRSEIDSVMFSGKNGYSLIFRWQQPRPIYTAFDSLHWGYWYVYASRIGSLGDDRHKWRVWDDYMAVNEPPPKGFINRPEHVYSKLQAMYGNNRRFTEDHFIAATLPERGVLHGLPWPFSPIKGKEENADAERPSAE